MDPPWSVLKKGGGARADDRLYKSDIPAICDYIAKVLTENGSALIRTTVQDWNLWADALETAHLSVETKPLIAAKDPSRCAHTQGRWLGRTTCYSMYMVAHKSSTYVWNREASGFLPKNHYGPSAAIMTGVAPPKKKERLLDHKGEVWRPQVTVAYPSSVMFIVDTYC